MKKVLFNLLVLFMSFLIAGTVEGFAQDKKLEQKQKNAAKSFINGTVTVIKAANTAKKNNPKKKKKGDDEEQGEAHIGKAIDHQKKAVELYKQNSFEKAIYHSMKARKFAMIAVKENKGDIQDQWEMDPEKVFAAFDKDKDFYKKVKKAMGSLKKPEIEPIEGELEQGVEVSTADPDPKDTKGWQEMEKSMKVQ